MRSLIAFLIVLALASILIVLTASTCDAWPASFAEQIAENRERRAEAVRACRRQEIRARVRVMLKVARQEFEQTSEYVKFEKEQAEILVKNAEVLLP